MSRFSEYRLRRAAGTVIKVAGTTSGPPWERERQTGGQRVGCCCYTTCGLYLLGEGGVCIVPEPGELA